MRTKLLSLKTLLVICLMAIVGGVETWAQTTEKVDFAAQGYSNGAPVTSYNKGKDFSVAFSKGTNTNNNSPMYYDSEASIHFYGRNTMTISSSSKSISKVVFTYGSKSPSSDTGYKLSSGSYSSSSNTWNSESSAGVSSVTFTNANKNGHYKIKTIEVTFASSVATPTITPASKKFDKSFEATIACTTTGATIYYTLDGTDPTSSTTRQTYTSKGVSIPAVTTTLKACASLNGKNSSVASATYTYTEQGDAPIVIWSEDWSGLSNGIQPTKGTNATYVCNGTGTKIYTGAMSAGGKSPELLIAKSGGSLAITINDLKGANEGLMFTFKTNQKISENFAMSADNAVILSSEVEGSKKPFVQKIVMALKEGATSLTITLKNSYRRDNVRVDDLELSNYSGVGSFKITEAGYGTYYTSDAYTMPKGVKGYTITGNEGTSLVMNEAYAAGDVVPAKTALVVEGAANKYYTLVAESTELTPANNKLHGSDKAETTYVDGTDVKYYKLSYNNEGNNLGFYWGSENGAAFTNGAHKAYLALNSETLLSQSRGFSLADLAHGVTTGINTTVKSATQSNFIYDLNGRRINSLNGAAKGVYIMNGQKVLVK